MLFREILFIYCDQHTKPTHKLTVTYSLTYLLTSRLYGPLRTLASIMSYANFSLLSVPWLRRFSFSSRIWFSTSFNYLTLGFPRFILRSGLHVLPSILVSSILVTSPYRFVRLLLISSSRSGILCNPFCCINTLCVCVCVCARAPN
jgi:hypothetical protein